MAFSFDDIDRLTDREIQRVLREVDARDLAIALKEAGPEVRRRIFSNVSERVGQMIREEMEASGPAHPNDVARVQSQVAQTVRRLQGEGQITSAREETPDVSERTPPDATPVAGHASASDLETILPPLTAALAPMGPRAREALISCLPDPLAGAVSARRPEGRGEEATPLERGLRAQAEEAWGDEGSKFEVRSSKFEGGLDLADVLALILRRARPAVLTRAFLQLPGRLPAEVLYRISAVNLSQVHHRIEEGAAGVFFWKLREALGDVRLKPAPELAARALRPIAPHIARQVLTAAHRIDPGATKAVQDLAYPFEDLAHLSDPELQMVLMGVENRDIALALQTTPAVVQNRVEQGMSARRRQAVEEEATLAGEVSAEAARSAQSRIVGRARLLYEQGQLHTYFGSIEDAGAAEQALKEARQTVYERHAAWVARWIRQSGQGRRQSVGVALAALALVAGGALLLKRLTAANRAVPPVQEAREERQRSGETEKRRAGETAKQNRGISGSPVLPVGEVGQGGGLRVSLAPGGEASGEGLQPGGGRRGIWLRAGTMRVVALDPTATLETPLMRVTGEVGAVYRVRVGLDTTTRLTALRGALHALPADGKGGATRIEAGQEAVFEPGRAVQVLTANPDAEDQAWLEQNR